MSKSSKKILSLILVIVLAFSLTVSASAGLWIFGSSGTGQNPFAPRGYSIVISGTNTWMRSHYDQDGTIAGSQQSATYSQTWTGTENVSAGASQIYAWLDKNPTGSVLPSANNKTYKDFLVVRINGGNFQPINTLDSSYNVTISDAIRTTDPDNHTRQWCIPITMTLKAGESYDFAFYRGFQANNQNTLALFEASEISGVQTYYGYVVADGTYNDNENQMYTQQMNTLYQFMDSYTLIATDANGRGMYSVSFNNEPFYHSVTAS